MLTWIDTATEFLHGIIQYLPPEQAEQAKDLVRADSMLTEILRRRPDERPGRRRRGRTPSS